MNTSISEQKFNQNPEEEIQRLKNEIEKLKCENDYLQEKIQDKEVYLDSDQE